MWVRCLVLDPSRLARVEFGDTDTLDLSFSHRAGGWTLSEAREAVPSPLGLGTRNLRPRPTVQASVSPQEGPVPSAGSSSSSTRSESAGGGLVTWSYLFVCFG